MEWLRITGHVCGLLGDEYGWYMNDVYRSFDEYIPAHWTDVQISRYAKRKLAIQGMRKDTWADDRFSWRDGTVGAYVVVHV